MTLSVCMIGLGYIGLPTAAILASHGVKAIGVDLNPSTVETINQGRIHIVEPGLEEIVKDVVARKMLHATTKPVAADAFIIAVPTPFKNNYEPDMAYVEAATLSIAPVLQKGNTVILESTSPVGSVEKIAHWLAQARPDLSFPHQAGEEADIALVYCPERVLPGNIVHELVTNDRVVGGMTPRCAKRGADVYKHFVRGECMLTDARTAEMCKLTENAFRDVNIAFANELSLICDHLKINVWELIRFANHHPRVKILQPGPGVGGHCIAVDPWFIVHSSPEQAKLIRQAREVNDGKPQFVINQVKTAAKDITNPTIACLGLAFKADIDDLRESPAIHIVETLISEKIGKLLVVEPHIKELPKSLIHESVKLVNAEEAITSADIVLLLVNHTEFKSYGAQAKAKRVIDTRGIWSI